MPHSCHPSRTASRCPLALSAWLAASLAVAGCQWAAAHTSARAGGSGSGTFASGGRTSREKTNTADVTARDCRGRQRGEGP